MPLRIPIISLAWLLLLGLPLRGAAAEGVPALALENHSLVNTLWDVHEARPMDRQALVASMLRAKYILLGEKHDNIVHHRHQAWAIRQLHRQSRQAGVAFEMIDTAQADQLGSPVSQGVDTLIDTLESGASGWKYRLLYKPVFEAVIAAAYPIYPANLPRAQIRDIARGKHEAQPGVVKQILQASPLDKQQDDALSREIRDSHCDMLGEAMIPSMVHVQRVRDAVMTHSLVANSAGHEQMVLIAGAGHVRADRGVPYYLRHQDSKARILTVGFIEVREEGLAPEDYTGRWDGEALPFDVVWFTPRAQRADPCEAMKARMHGAKTRDASGEAEP